MSIPERHYEFVGEILLDALDDVHDGESPSDAVARVAYDRGRKLGAQIRSQRRLGRLGPERAMTVVSDVLADLGFEPGVTNHGLIERNCPFRRLAQRSPELVCGVNHRFVAGMLDGVEASRLRAALRPSEGRCCVVVTVK